MLRICVRRPRLKELLPTSAFPSSQCYEGKQVLCLSRQVTRGDEHQARRWPEAVRRQQQLPLSRLAIAKDQKRGRGAGRRHSRSLVCPKAEQTMPSAL